MGPFGHICQSKATHSDYLLQSSYYNPIQSYYTTLFVSSYPITHPSILSYPIIHPSPTLDFSTILRLIVHYYPTFYPTSSYPIIHWIVHPSYLILPHPTTGLFSHPTLSYPIIHPTTSYTGLFIHPTPSYHNLPSYLIVPFLV
jgi:hypothetical protein